MDWLGLAGISQDLLAQPLFLSRVSDNRFPRTTSRWVLNISKERDSTTSCGNLFQCSTTMFNQQSTAGDFQNCTKTLSSLVWDRSLHCSGQDLGIDTPGVTSNPKSFMVSQMVTTDVSRLQLYECKSPLDSS